MIITPKASITHYFKVNMRALCAHMRWINHEWSKSWSPLIGSPHHTIISSCLFDMLMEFVHMLTWIVICKQTISTPLIWNPCDTILSSCLYIMLMESVHISTWIAICKQSISVRVSILHNQEVLDFCLTATVSL